MRKKDKHGSEVFTLSRRNFLKLTALTTGGIAAPLSMPEAVSASSPSGMGKAYDREVNSCCQFCQVRCTTKVQVKNGCVVNIYGNPDNFWTEGGMCPKGQSLVELTYSPHRLLYPLKREGGEWKRIPYQQAVDLIAERVLKVKADFPEDDAHRVVMFAPLWESHESELMADMTLHIAGFPDICHPGDACIGNSGAALNLCLGSPITPTTLDETLNSQLIILWGINLAETYPLYIRWIGKARSKGIKVLYIDPRRTPTSNHCDDQLLLRPGTDGALALGVIRLLIKEIGYDRKYVENHVNGFGELVEACESYTPDRVAKITWLSEDKIRDVALRIGRSDGTIIWLGGSLSRYTNSIQTVRIIIALQAITGNLSGPGRGLMSVQGGKPGGSEAFDEIYRTTDLVPGLSFRKVLYNMERDKVKVLLLNSSYRRYPDANRVKKAIEKVEFVVYRGFFMDEEAKLAHLILPATMAFESAGSQYGVQRQVVWREKTIPSLGETVEDWRFYRDLGKRINKGKFPDIGSVEEIYELFRKHAPSWAGLTLDRLKKDPTGISWPCPSVGHPGTKGTLYPGNRFLTKDGKVELHSGALGLMAWSEPEGSPLRDSEKQSTFPLIFIQGKVVQHWQHTYTNWSAYTAQFSEGNFVQVHPETVEELGMKDGDWVYLETELGKIKATLKLSELILPGVVWTPSHPEPEAPHRGNSGQSINTIIPGYWDEVSAQFNGFGCRLTKV
jgi:anaerobic selenocysteine-containing dehydrogenase